MAVNGNGYIGTGKYKSKINGKNTKAYQCWVDMLRRCYCPRTQAYGGNQVYIGCTVSDDWRNFQNFAKFHEENYIEGYHLDKDTLVDGNKLYSAETCQFIPPVDNIRAAVVHKEIRYLLSPEGVTYPVTNISLFAKEHGLSQSHLTSVLTGARRVHKGWTKKVT